MNSETFDFNINNYSITDLENFLDLDDDYNDDDITQKITDFSFKINKINDMNFKNKLKEFIKEVKDVFIKHKKKNEIISAGATFIINDTNKNPVTNYTQQVYSSDIAKGDITLLKKKSVYTTFCINTLFRDTNSLSSTDCIIELPYQVNNVISMQVTSMEIPQGIFLFSNSLQSNTIYFKEYTEDTVTEGLVTFPPGNYPAFTSAISPSTLPDIATMMTNEINIQLNTGNRFVVSIDSATNRITITNSTYIFEMYIVYPGTNRNISRTMGWILGFRELSYVNHLSYTSESIYNVTPTEYLYLEINDFNISQIASKIFGLFSESYLDRNIIAKIDYTYGTNYLQYNTISYNTSRVLGNVRDYFGPVYLKKLSIRLLDKYGGVVDLNGLDFSFTLELKLLHDL